VHGRVFVRAALSASGDPFDLKRNALGLAEFLVHSGLLLLPVI
jgi:hypothetical protein